VVTPAPTHLPSRLRASSPLLLVALLLGIVAGPASAASPTHPLVTGVTDLRVFESGNAALAFRRVRAAGGTTVVLQANWSTIAPGGKTMPAGFNPSDPGDPHYDWASLDREVTLATRAGLQPILTVSFAPAWAQPQVAAAPYEPDPDAFGAFARAAATRYSGQYAALPRVRYWQAWNEPNITTFLLPQFLAGQPFSPGWYRKMVNAFAASVHGAAPGNVVIAGAVAPFADAGVFDRDKDWGPLSFMRALLCISPSLKPTCSDRITFDVWSTHPYTSGGPTHRAYRPNDVSLGDLGKMHRVLLAAQRAHHIRLTRHGLGFWATEFSWDSSPPDPKAVPMATLQQWIPRALEVMWENGITHVVWFTIRDDRMATSSFQSGLYFNGGSFARDRPKPLLANFRFPVVLTPQTTGFAIWGRTPSSLPARVVLQTTTSRGWRTFGSLTADRYGIFRGDFTGVSVGTYIRGVIAKTGDASGRVRSAPIADHFYNPFGSTPSLEPG
jgi:hypothetical protein